MSNTTPLFTPEAYPAKQGRPRQCAWSRYRHGRCTVTPYSRAGV